MLTKEQARKHIERALSLASFPECDIRIDSLEKASIRFALNGVTTSGVTVEQWMTISSGKEGRFGSTTLSEFDDKSIRDAVKRSEELATLSPRTRSGSNQWVRRSIRSWRTLGRARLRRATRRS